MQLRSRALSKLTIFNESLDEATFLAVAKAIEATTTLTCLGNPTARRTAADDQLENFIPSDNFIDFLQHAETKRFPAWSMATVIERGFLLLCPQYPRRSRLEVIQRSWRAIRSMAICWLVQWAEVQNSSYIQPLIYTMCNSSTMGHILRVRLLVRYPSYSARSVKKQWHNFWHDVYTSVLDHDMASVSTIMHQMEAHLQDGVRINSMDPKPGAVRHRHHVGCDGVCRVSPFVRF